MPEVTTRGWRGVPGGLSLARPATWRAFDPVRLARAMARRPEWWGGARPEPVDRSTDRERSLYRAVTRRALRGATGLAAMTIAASSVLNAIALVALVPHRLGAVLAINGIETGLALGAMILVLGPARTAPLPVAFALAFSGVVTVLHQLVFLPETRTISLMALALIPPAVALFLPWSVRVHAAWLLAVAGSLATFTVSGVGSAIPAGDWIGAWLVIAIAGLSSLVGQAGASAMRRGAFGVQMQGRRARLGVLAREAELERLNAELQRTSRLDPLTGLGNRLRMNEELGAAVARSNRYGTRCALVLLDLDNFKGYNDALGHLAGDAALRRVARAVRSAVRASDTACRFGGEELVVILPEQSLEDGEVAAERIRAAVEHLALAYPSPEGQRILTISAGVAQLRRGVGQADDDALRAADRALYAAKSTGRNRVVTWSAGGEVAGGEH